MTLVAKYSHCILFDISVTINGFPCLSTSGGEGGDSLAPGSSLSLQSCHLVVTGFSKLDTPGAFMPGGVAAYSLTSTKSQIFVNF